MVHRSKQTFWFGPHLSAAEAEFRLWAPAERDIVLEVQGHDPVPLQREEDGACRAALPAGAGARYRFRLDTQIPVPDPASRAQEGDIFDPSLVVDPSSYVWRCENWAGRPWEEVILYELHVGLLGGFAGVARQLERIAAIGFTAIELMPVADFPGARNWGYDGVLPFAPDRAYGTPDELKALIDRAHGLGMMVFLDVVYNHFGPEGNRLPEYAPQFFRSDVRTPWGDAIDFRQPMVRRFFLENAIYWIHEFRLDGLRLDAVHAIGDRDFLIELASHLRATVPDGRHVHLVLENDDNDAQLLARGFDAQWNDDLHHALHVLLTGETTGYYEDYAAAPAEALARALAEGFVYQGQPSRHRGEAPRGTPSAHLAPMSFVSFLQNHDQIGNQALGERLIALANPDALRAAVALQLLAPQIPLVFMGEEAGAEEPFLYFTDHRDPELAQAVREGRRGEFAKFPEFSDPGRREQIPDPNAPETFERSRPVFDGTGAKGWNELYAALIRVRQEQIIPRLVGAKALGAQALGNAAVFARWRLGDGATLSIATNLGNTPVRAHLPRSIPVWGKPCEVLPAAATIAWIDT